MKFMYVNFHLRVLGETDLQLVILITPVEEKTYFLFSFPYVTIGKRLINNEVTLFFKIKGITKKGKLNSTSIEVVLHYSRLAIF